MTRDIDNGIIVKKENSSVTIELCKLLAATYYHSIK